MPYQGKPNPGISGLHNKAASQGHDTDARQDLLAVHVPQQLQTWGEHIASGNPIQTIHQTPINFSRVSEGLYRSGYPQTPDYPFIQGLNLKTIVTLVNKEIPDGYQAFIQENRITHKIFDMAGTKKEDIPIELMRSIHAVVSDRANYPLLIHCNQGRHRTGCVVGVLRKSSQWNMKHILNEYATFAEPKVREVDIKYLAEFELTNLLCPSQSAAAPTTVGRFYGFIIVTLLTLFAFYPLSKFKVQEPRPKNDLNHEGVVHTSYNGWSR
ncbi:tyrosine phosphatase family-domain-containing protein [Xylaria bambusicola]|uniref:tyrosine phosphatase family-domain-containing protein n=1 Tax=Xylaria bambusicola TaxID=326684 RepID=UPI002007D5C8|nr:tyrosine phosphatase family-domain-containing protein [Xylaria bambusicola]KAI0517260.1 tyrosine phosphatase family-domain-containing protein [Xylaria bambusicola]